jgi:glutathione S-transferase
MLKFYYSPISVNARRVWVTLLEKYIPFEPVILYLDDDQFHPEFTAINPFQRVPVLVDGDLQVVESLAILDYLEAAYPSPALVPKIPEEIAIVRMVEMVSVNELQPATIPLMKQLVQLEVQPEIVEISRQCITTVLQFFESLLGRGDYFLGAELSLADIVAGTLMPSLPMFGFDLRSYPKVNAWAERLSQRESWQHTTPAPEQIESALPIARKILARR